MAAKKTPQQAGGNASGITRQARPKQPGSTRQEGGNRLASAQQRGRNAPGPLPDESGTPAASGAEEGGKLSDDAITIAWLRRMMTDFVRERRWEKYHIPRNLAASVSVEAGELLELFQWLTPEEAAKRAKKDPAFRKAVGEEMCDVMMYCISLANAMDLPVAQTIAAKMAKNRAKYPPERFYGHYERPLS